MIEETQKIFDRLEYLKKLKFKYEDILNCEYLSDEDKLTIKAPYIKIKIQYEQAIIDFENIQANCKHDFKYYCGGHNDDIYRCIKCGKDEER